uniref:Uncharacterized protein n=1 Tax=Romanomermis culicivorax TaxID=13658 RepID=A0A915J5L1_ROMCU
CLLCRSFFNEHFVRDIPHAVKVYSYFFSQLKFKMTKLDFNMGKKSDAKETDNLQQIDLSKERPETPIILIGDIVGGVNKSDIGGAVGNEASAPKMATPAGPVDVWATTFDWKGIKRAAVTQMIFSMIAMICILISIMATGMTSYKFSQFIIATYLLVTGHGGLRGSTKSYKHLIFYLIMSALQWMINIMVLGCLTYAMYDAPYVNYSVRQTIQTIDFDDYGTGIALITAELVGSLCMMGTIITGMLGLTHCCRGFGNVLMNQEKYFKMMNRNQLEQA